MSDKNSCKIMDGLCLTHGFSVSNEVICPQFNGSKDEWIARCQRSREATPISKYSDDFKRLIKLKALQKLREILTDVPRFEDDDVWLRIGIMANHQDEFVLNDINKKSFVKPECRDQIKGERANNEVFDISISFSIKDNWTSPNTTINQPISIVFE